MINFWFYVAMFLAGCLAVAIFTIRGLKDDILMCKEKKKAADDEFIRIINGMNKDSIKLSAIWEIVKSRPDKPSDK